MRTFPLPWIRSNYTIKVKEISQFYIKQKLNRNKDGTTYSNQLKYLDINQHDKNFLPTGLSMDEHDVQKMERIFEDLLRIKDFSVPVQYGGKSFQTFTSKKEFRLPINRPINNDPFEKNLMDIQINGFVDYKLESYHIIHEWQFDADAWKSYKLFSGKSTNEEANFFFEVGGGNMILVEKEILSIILNSKAPINLIPEEIGMGKEIFKHSQAIRSMKFDLSSNASLFEAEFAFYMNQDFDQVLRIELKQRQRRLVRSGEFFLQLIR